MRSVGLCGSSRFKREMTVIAVVRTAITSPRACVKEPGSFPITAAQREHFRDTLKATSSMQPFRRLD